MKLKKSVCVKMPSGEERNTTIHMNGTSGRAGLRSKTIVGTGRLSLEMSKSLSHA